MSGWEDFDAPCKATPEPLSDALTKDTGRLEDERELRLIDLAENLQYLTGSIEGLKQERKHAIAEVEALIPETHEGPVRAGAWDITVERSDRMVWDKKILGQILQHEGLAGDASVPAFLERETKMNSKAFDAQPKDVQKTWIPALTRQKGTTKVLIRHNPDRDEEYGTTDA